MRSMIRSLELGRRPAAMTLLAGIISVGGAGSSHASDHLDTPTVIANPQADIGDVYAWTSPDGRQLNLVMTIVAHTFSDKLRYVFHIDSGNRFGKTTTTTSIVCRFPAANALECQAGDVAYARGHESNPGAPQR